MPSTSAFRTQGSIRSVPRNPPPISFRFLKLPGASVSTLTPSTACVARDSSARPSISEEDGGFRCRAWSATSTAKMGTSVNLDGRTLKSRPDKIRLRAYEIAFARPTARRSSVPLWQGVGVRSKVMVALACPWRSATVRTSTPAAISVVTEKCRRSWNRYGQRSSGAQVLRFAFGLLLAEPLERRHLHRLAELPKRWVSVSGLAGTPPLAL